MASQGVVDPQSIVLCTPVPWPYRASMDNAPLDEPRVPTALVLLTELDLPVAPLADRGGTHWTCCETGSAPRRSPSRTGPCCRRPSPAEAAAHHPGHDPALLEECRTLSLGLATTWRFDRQDTFPDGRAIGEAWLTEVRARVEG